MRSKPYVTQKQVERIENVVFTFLFKLGGALPFAAIAWFGSVLLLSMVLLYSISLERWSYTGVFKDSWNGYTIDPIMEAATVLAIIPAVYVLITLYKNTEVKRARK